VARAFFPILALDVSIGFADKGKSHIITLLGMEKGPLPRMQQFSVLVAEKKVF
jgi:hypothetical protein